MDFSKNSKAFLSALPKNLSGAEKFLAVALYSVGGSANQPAKTKDVQGKWHRSVLKISYNPAYYHKAQVSGWVNALEPGLFEVTESGLSHMESLIGTLDFGQPKNPGHIHIFDKSNTHSFDKFLRGHFKSATTEVLIADSYVDETIFDNVLDTIDKTVPIKLIYGRQMNSFSARVARFKSEYTGFTVRRFKRLHDRFIIVDGVGYVIGPSIKDAAENSPALVIKLDAADSKTLRKFFNRLWLNSNQE